MKIKYIETEEELGGHGCEFHYTPITIDPEKYSLGEPVAFLGVSGIWENVLWRDPLWMNNTRSIPILIRPASSPKLKDIDEDPKMIIAEVKEAIELFLIQKGGRLNDQYIPLTEHVFIWVNA